MRKPLLYKEEEGTRLMKYTTAFFAGAVILGAVYLVAVLQHVTAAFSLIP